MLLLRVTDRTFARILRRHAGCYVLRHDQRNHEHGCPRVSHKDAKKNLRAVIAEYLVLDDRVTEDKILKLLIDAVTKPTSEQALVVQLHIKGTRANKLYRTPENKFTEDDRRFYEGIDDFRARNL